MVIPRKNTSAAHGADGTRLSRWAVLTAVPHRPMFLLGMVQLVAALLLWLAELAARLDPSPAAPFRQIPGALAHPLLLLYLAYPCFAFGFLLTTYPRWMGDNPVPQHSFVAAFLPLAAGALLSDLGLLVHPGLLATGLLLALAGWGLSLAALWQVYRRAPATDKHYETWLNWALLAGVAGLAVAAAGIVAGHWALPAYAVGAGLWLFLLPALITVSHRMIPYFSRCVLQDYVPVQPAWSLPLMGLCTAGHFALELAGASHWLLVCDLPLAALAWHHTLHWGLRRSLQVRLLAMLHLAFAWLAIGMSLYLIHDLGALLDRPWLPARAAVHALTIGFITGMILAMATRVTLGHSGRALVADGYTWACFVGVNVAAVLRVGAELAGAWSLQLNVAAAATLLGCLLPWALRYGPMLVRPRVDGRPG